LPEEARIFSYHGGNVITGIGSFPFTNIDEAIDLIFSVCKEIPFWPQLPKRSYLENMYTTFLEGVPCTVVDTEKNTVFIDTEQVEGIEKFYEDVASDNIDAFRITDNVAPGFYRFLERLKDIQEGVKYIKCQVTGPFSMGLGLKDEHDKPIIYNDAFYDIIKKALHMKAKWMIQTIKAAYPEKDIIIFFDEPYMVSFGSSYVSISKETALSAFNEVLDGLNAKRGVHVCGNTDWSVLLNSHVDIINYDAFNYLDTIFYYKEDLARFLARGGWIAPGIVPSSEQVLETPWEDILKIRSAFMNEIRELSPEAGSRDHLFTTSCGLGSLTVIQAQKAMELLKKLNQLM
jgi:hypothetical protein